MTKKKLIRALSVLVCGAIGASCVPTLAGCTGKKDSIVIMTEELSGLFNPFYATSGTDQDVVGLTQIGMLSTDDAGNPEAGDDLPTVVKAYSSSYNAQTDKTTYQFVIKNGLKFSDGVPLTMNDIMFNIYEYLDPVYTGSSTMYSIDIEGLTQYRTQTNYSSGGTEAESEISSQAAAYARLRRNELVDVYEENARIGGSASSTFSATEAEMKEYISQWSVSVGYKDAVATSAQQATMTEDDYRAKLVEDYEFTLQTFREELEADFKAAKESYDLNSLPYSEWKSELSSDIFKFFLYEGYITPVYVKVNGRDDKTQIEKFDNTSIVDSYPTEEAAINRVYGDNVKTALNSVLTGWGTAGTVVTQYTADATEILIKNNMSGDGLAFPNISGIVSLGHTTSVTSVTIDNVTYNVAHEHDEDEVPVNQDEYDVLQITINGVDPKAIYNFGFTVAPAHYYGADDNGNTPEMDIKNNKFGVEYASSSFQSKVIQSEAHVTVPVGAGPYQATNKSNEDNPTGSEFWSSNIVYYKANPNFMFDVKTEKIRMQVVSPSDALDKLASGEVDYVQPQFTRANSQRLTTMVNTGNYGKLDAWQLGYGYIGINAGKVPNINIRRAIMSAMQTQLAVEYYDTGTCETIDWPMSKVSWAYPSGNNGHDYTQWTTEAAAKAKIQKYMNAAGVSAGDSQLKITFTIAGASITEHPSYEVFKQASELLNELGWDVEVKADSQALTKLSTGSLAVWAAAWGSTIDPDMYQVYHKNSYATSVYAWGYREIKAAPSTYPEETVLINELSELIDDGREIDSSTEEGKAQRIAIYKEAMGKVLDLAIELPVYQRKNLYAYNAKTVKGFPETVNAYSSPLEKIWELELIG